MLPRSVDMGRRVEHTGVDLGWVEAMMLTRRLVSGVDRACVVLSSM